MKTEQAERDEIETQPYESGKLTVRPSKKKKKTRRLVRGTGRNRQKRKQGDSGNNKTPGETGRSDGWMGGEGESGRPVKFE